MLHVEFAPGVEPNPAPVGPHSHTYPGQVSNLSQQFFGRGLESLFPPGAAEVRPVPFDRASRRKSHQDFDQELVNQVLSRPIPPLEEIDPRTLRATQRSITKGGVQYYTSDPTYQESGLTYADQANPGNAVPLVYQRDGQNVLLSGHHRASAALVRGEALKAQIVQGPWGPPRNRK